MERTRNPMDDVGILALMAKMPLMANAQLTANALFGANELGAEPSREESRGPGDPGSAASEARPEDPRRGLLDRLDHWFWTLEQRALEDRLSQATDIYDLEVRIREIERGTPWWSH